MKQFVICMVIVLALDIVSKISSLHKGYAARTLTSIALDAVFNVVLLMWGVWVLGQSS